MAVFNNMEFLGVGPLELFFILIIALIFLGPGDMVKAGRTMGRFMRRIVKSPTWHAVQQTSQEIRYLPNRLMREAGMEEDLKDLDRISKEVKELGNIKTTMNTEISNSWKGIAQETTIASRAQPELEKSIMDADHAAWTTPPAAPDIVNEQNPVAQDEAPADTPESDSKQV